MTPFLSKFAANPAALSAVCIALGLGLGKIRIGRFSLGSSGALFIGLFIGWVVVRLAPEAQRSALAESGVIGKDLFYIALCLFITSVALSASRYLNKVIKVYGLRLLALGILVPFAGALVAFLLSRVIPGIPSRAVPGVFTGALTSSPGLAAALEQVAHLGSGAESDVGFGYAVGYIPGVLSVVLGMQIIPIVFKLDSSRENRAFCEDLEIDPQPISTSPNTEPGGFRPLEFFLVIALGSLLGQIKIPLGPLGRVGLGSTGGILTVGLILGSIGKTGPLQFRMGTTALAAIRELGIALFLSVVGLRYGYNAVNSMTSGGLPLLALSLAAALTALTLGFLFGRYILKLNWILLAGALCGAMTSTPGLGAAVDATNCDDVATGYGAVYPVALFSMVLFTIILSIF